ncbi:glycoside hydrolase family 16 protein [Pterulicium gracile]|uniref:Glycoside hydrolase family 16 protein n=1 Tax=Pterulicium gracile TaxID=1884261 RepID=A0A5C3QT74_9AGAR|nr:glycoside hydrolase family 16 protein [Pterula gracilis]
MLFISSSLLVSVLPLLSYAKSNRSRSHTSIAKRYQTPHKNYVLDVKYQGADFFTEWDFFHWDDPTNGQVNYVNLEDATNRGLAYVQHDNSTVFGVDSTNDLPLNAKRDSVRISSKRRFSGGLFIADFNAMPHGCGTWPAYWSTGPEWPKAGEIDVIEGVNQQIANQYTMHTVDEGCSLQEVTTDLKTFTANLIHERCASKEGDNSGCAFKDSDEASYGKGLNEAGGGVFVHLWDQRGIKFWFFNRNSIPHDIVAGNPDPSSWGLPKAHLASTRCDVAKYFYEHVLVINTSLCGSYAGNVYQDQGCPGTCAERIMSAGNFVDAKWNVNHISVYQPAQSQ